MGKRLASVVVTLLASFALVLGVTGTASATALGYAYWGVHVYKDIPIPSGQLTALIKGSGTRVDGWSMNWGSPGNLCNHHMSVQFLDRNNVNYQTYNQSNQGNCAKGGSYTVKFATPIKVRDGRVCMRLYRDFGRENLASVCHGIHG